MSLRVCVAGATGWTGSAVARAVLAAADLRLVAAVARKAAGRTLTDALGAGRAVDMADDQDVMVDDQDVMASNRDVIVSASSQQALRAEPDVWIDYTHPSVAESHVLAALEAGAAVVVGTSGLDAAAYRRIRTAAQAAGTGVVAAGNFSLTAALLKHLAGIAARRLPHREVVDYAHAGKPDAPSGTALELAEFLSDVPLAASGERSVAGDGPVPATETLGRPDARGAAIERTQVHSVRLPGYTISVEVLFGLPGERLAIRHDAGESPDPYVAGTLLAARRVRGVDGLVRGLDTLLFG